MSYDGIVMRAVSLELDQLLKGGRIDKIHQPAKTELVLAIRQTGQNYKLLLSAQAQDSRVQLTTKTKPNPQEPPLFCMVLRKHLEGGRIISVSQQGLERIMEIECEIVDDLGDLARRKLIIEVMGKHSNIILVDPRDNRILDSIQRISQAVSRYRQVLPGLTYQTPPPQDKLLPWSVDQDLFYEKFLGLPLSLPIQKALLNLFAGLGPQTVQEIIARSGLEPTTAVEFCGEYELSHLWQAFEKFATASKNGVFSPEIIVKDKVPLAFSAIQLTHFPENLRRAFPTMNEALDFFYRHKDTSNQLEQKRGDLLHLVKKETERCEKKAGLQQETILEAARSEQYRLWGELLMAHQHQLTQGQQAEVVNYYEPDGRLELIPLDEHLSIVENGRRYFEKYQKAKQAAQKAEFHYNETKSELDYLYSLTASLENITLVEEAEEIRDELREAGYLKALIKGKGKAQPPASQPQKLHTEGFDLYWGKNNKQNDLLTMKLSKGEDLWFHTKDIPGSHVVIKNPQGQPIPDAVLEKAALLAAFHSQARGSTHIPVDYTLRKHVWKPKGAKPGMVLYENQRTIYVTPLPEVIHKILEPEE